MQEAFECFDAESSVLVEPEYQNCNSWHWHIGSGLLTVHRENGALLKFYPIITKKTLDLVFAGSFTNVTGVSRVFRAALQISSLTQISSKIEFSKYFANEQISSKIYFSSKFQVRFSFQNILQMWCRPFDRICNWPTAVSCVEDPDAILPEHASSDRFSYF